MLTTVNAPHNNKVIHLAICKVVLALHSHHSSNYIGHHDFLPSAKHRAIDIRNNEPVGYANITSEV